MESIDCNFFFTHGDLAILMHLSISKLPSSRVTFLHPSYRPRIIAPKMLAIKEPTSLPYDRVKTEPGSLLSS